MMGNLKQKISKKPQTTLGKHVSFVLEQADHVMSFDRARLNLRLHPNQCSARNSYHNELARIQQKVFAAHEKLKCEIDNW